MNASVLYFERDAADHYFAMSDETPATKVSTAKDAPKKAIEVPLLSKEDVRHVAQIVVRTTGGALPADQLSQLLNYVLAKFKTYKAFAADPDSREMLTFGIGPALVYAFVHRLAPEGCEKKQ